MVRQSAILENEHWDELTELANKAGAFVSGPVRFSRNDLIRLSLIHLYGEPTELSEKDLVRLGAIKDFLESDALKSFQNQRRDHYLAKAVE